MDERPEIDHCQFSRGALRHSHLRAYRENMARNRGLLPACVRYRVASTRGDRDLDYRSVR